MRFKTYKFETSQQISTQNVINKKELYDKQFQDTTQTVSQNIGKLLSQRQKRLEGLHDIGALEFTAKIYQAHQDPFDNQVCNCCVIL